MFLNRIGKKTRLAKQIIGMFPPHDVYIEPFFGAGGLFFQKPKARHNIVNDLDEDVYNLFDQLIHNSQELLRLYELTPVSEKLFLTWAKGCRETDPVLKAIRFLVLSNWGLYGKPNTLRIGILNFKQSLLEQAEKLLYYLKDVIFTNVDFRDFLNKKITFRSNREKDRFFCYCDPPYVGTDHNYQSGFTLQDLTDLLTLLKNLKIRFAVSEFDNPDVLELAKNFDLNVYRIKNRQSIKNRNTEILICNYTPNYTLFDYAKND